MKPDEIDEVLARLRSFVAARDWEQYHNPKNLAMMIASEAGELLAELRWVRDSDSDKLLTDTQFRQRIENEIADIAIGLFLLCDRSAIDLRKAIFHKLKLNEKNYPVASVKGSAERPGRYAARKRAKRSSR